MVDIRQLSRDRPFLIIAHQGMPSRAPENTIKSFDMALEHGFTHLELDLQITSDGVPVAFHDELLDRTTDGSGPLARYTLDELKGLDAGRWFSQTFAGERIPTLDEILRRYQGRAFLHLEIKPGESDMLGAVSKVLSKSGWITVFDPDNLMDWPKTGVSIISFQLAQLERAHDAMPEVPTAWLVQELTPEAVELAGERRLMAICPRASTVTSEGVQAAWSRGLAVLTWGCRNDEELAHVVRSRVHGATSDSPDQTQAYLRQLGVSTFP